MSSLHRYWFEFELSLDDPRAALGVLAGCGVTASDYDTALCMLRERVFKNQQLPPFRQVVEGVDVSTLDPGHVLPNMRAPIWPGIWFPLGFD